MPSRLLKITVALAGLHGLCSTALAKDGQTAAALERAVLAEATPFPISPEFLTLNDRVAAPPRYCHQDPNAQSSSLGDRHFLNRLRVIR
jgi:hypothetical protein